MTLAAITETDRVRANTNPEVLHQIDAKIEESIRSYASKSPEEISKRIEQLDNEWDVERWLESNAACTAITGLVFGVAFGKKWLLLTAGALGFLLQHATQGWCPPIALLRKMGIRTRTEIDREKYALKILRGDFRQISADLDQLKRNGPREVLNVVSS